MKARPGTVPVASLFRFRSAARVRVDPVLSVISILIPFSDAAVSVTSE